MNGLLQSVWIVTRYNGEEDQELKAAFSSQEKAERYAEQEELKPLRPGSVFFVNELRVDALEDAERERLGL